MTDAQIEDVEPVSTFGTLVSPPEIQPRCFVMQRLSTGGFVPAIAMRDAIAEVLGNTEGKG
jgi:hypothetical protein